MVGKIVMAVGNKIMQKVRFVFSYLRFKGKLTKEQRGTMLWRERIACFGDNVAKTGFDGHYLYHTAWAARIIAEIKPLKHVDVSSCISFVANLSAFIPVDYYDYRPPQLYLSNLSIGQADLLSLPFASNSLHSLSCMHVVEHIGLGRYGDVIDVDGADKAISELKRVVVSKGNLLMAVPIGKEKILFNAHRVFDFRKFVSKFIGFELKEFCLVPDDYLEKGILSNSGQLECDRQKYGCGCFWFVKE
ncbi:MAG: DUF268 domain-containing protein [Negativicutes bacterium]|jgi:hypothetical protein